VVAGNEEPTATNAKGANIVTAMKEVAARHDGLRLTTIDGMINGEAAGSGTGGLAVLRRDWLSLRRPAGRSLPQGAP